MRDEDLCGESLHRLANAKLYLSRLRTHWVHNKWMSKKTDVLASHHYQSSSLSIYYWVGNNKRKNNNLFIISQHANANANFAHSMLFVVVCGTFAVLLFGTRSRDLKRLPKNSQTQFSSLMNVDDCSNIHFCGYFNNNTLSVFFFHFAIRLIRTFAHLLFRQILGIP